MPDQWVSVQDRKSQASPKTPINFIAKECFCVFSDLASTLETLTKNFQLEWGVGVSQQLLEISLKPCAGFWGRLKCIRETTMGIVACSRCVRCTIALSTWLDPNKSIFERVSGVCSWADAKSCIDNVAPISPGVLRSRLHSISGYAACQKCFQRRWSMLSLQVSVIKCAG